MPDRRGSEQVAGKAFADVVKEERGGLVTIGQRFPVVDELASPVEHGIAEAEIRGGGDVRRFRTLHQQGPSARALGVGDVVDQQGDAELALFPVLVPG